MSYQNLRKKTEGFTIIEVLIVLAIAALIMLIVFLAIPALRRNQSNSQLRAEASRVLSGATEFESNANGQTIGTGPAGQAQVTTIYNSALNGTPAANRKLTGVTLATASATADVPVGTGELGLGTCNGTGFTYDANARTYALRIGLQGGQTACTQS